MGNLPAALPPHGTVLAWALGCRREQCECAYQRLVSELALRCRNLAFPQHFAPTHPERRSGPWAGSSGRGPPDGRGSRLTPHPATCDELATRDAGCTLFPSAPTLPP